MNVTLDEALADVIDETQLCSRPAFMRGCEPGRTTRPRARAARDRPAAAGRGRRARVARRSITLDTHAKEHDRRHRQRRRAVVHIRHRAAPVSGN